MLRNSIIWGWICWTTFRSHAIKHISRFYIRYNDKWYNIIFFIFINPFVVYNSFFGFGVSDCVYPSTGICSSIFRLHQRWAGFTLIFLTYLCSMVSSKENYINKVLPVQPIPCYYLKFLPRTYNFKTLTLTVLFLHLTMLVWNIILSQSY